MNRTPENCRYFRSRMRALFVIAVGVLLTATLLIGGAVAESNENFVSGEASGAGVSVTAIQVTSPQFQENNSTDPHRNPEEYERSGDLEALQKWLNNDMSESLRGSTLAISQSEYELAKSHLGDSFNHSLERFVEVAGETDQENAENTATTLQETQNAQREYVSTLQEFQEVKDRYERAKSEGNRTETRRLARTLISVAEELEETNESVSRKYEDLETQTGTDFAREQSVLHNETREVVEYREDIREDEFVATELSIETNSEEASFNNPVQIQGTLQTENGSTLDSEPVRLHVVDTIQSNVSLNGTNFRLKYRPVNISLGRQEISVQYRPSESSVYLGSNATVPVTIRQVKPEIVVDSDQRSVGFGEKVNISTKVHVNNQSVAGLPIRTTLAGRTISRSLTKSEGRVNSQLMIPAWVPPGNQTIKVAHERTENAIGPANSSVPIQVESTATRIDMSVSVDEGKPTVSGNLVTEDGISVPNQEVRIDVNGTTVNYTKTNGNGDFNTSFSKPEGVGPNLSVSAVYSGEGTNLEGDTASMIVSVAEGSGSNGQWTPLVPVMGGVLLFGIMVAGFILMRVRSSDENATESPSEHTNRNTTPELEADTADMPALERPRRLLREEQVGPSIIAAYWIVRDSLGNIVNSQKALTHWEFLERVDAAESDQNIVKDVRTLTKHYERAAFAQDTPSPLDGAKVLAAAKRIVERKDDRS